MLKNDFKMNKIKLCSILIIIILISLIIQYNYPKIKDSYKIKAIYQWINSTNLEIIERKGKCNIFTNIKNKQFVIDNKLYPNILPKYHNKTIDFQCLNSQNNKKKTILLWTKFKGVPLIPLTYGYQKPFEDMKCPVTNCELTDDRSKINQSSLVLFHLRNSIYYFPQHRPLNQRWVHIIYESPINCHLCDQYTDTFNLTATYTKDSDFSSLYWTDSGLYWDLNSNYNKSDIYANKTEFAATLISSCNAPSSRTKYIKELQNYIAINLYGKCGKPCPKDQDCRQYISEKYKFFILFENSICRDYITEKFFETLRYDIIPIVLGGGDYSYYAPKSGYINALDFKTPQDLANYLNYLNTNKTAYNEYFQWKKYINFDKNYPQMAFLCEMCIQLNLEEHTGVVEQKMLNEPKKLYNMNENCYGTSFENNTLKIIKGNNLAYSYYMSPE